MHVVREIEAAGYEVMAMLDFNLTGGSADVGLTQSAGKQKTRACEAAAETAY